MNLLHEPIDTIIGKMGHASPELGGSTGSLLSGQLGLAMIRMALAVSQAREDGRSLDIAEALAQVDRISATLARKTDADRDAFRAFLEAMKQHADPSSQDADIHKAALATLAELLDGAALLVAALELATSLPDVVAETVQSDLFGGAALLDAAFAGVSLAVQINLRPRRMEGERQPLRQKLDTLDAKRKKAYGLLTGRAGAAGFLP